MFVDTGSQVTLIDDSLIRRLNLQRNLRETESRLSSFTKDAIPATGEITLELEVAGLATNHRCIVVKNLLDTEVLLGADFMTAHNISIELGNGVVKSRFGQTQCIPTEKSIPKRTKIRASKSFVIPARSVMHITGSLENRYSQKYTGLIEPYNNLLPNKGILVANAMANSLTRTVPVKVMNPTENDVVIYKRKLIGFLCPVDVADDNRHLAGLKVQRISDNHGNQHTNASAVNRPDWTKEWLFDELKLGSLQIPEENKRMLEEVLWKYRDCFSRDANDIGDCNMFQAKIELQHNAEPSWIPSRPVAYKLRGEMRKQIDDLLAAGVIGECKDSRWNSPVFLVEKPHKPGSYRFVADLRGVNKLSLPDKYELPNVNHVVDRIGKCKFFSTFDMSQSFHQVRYTSESRPITSFTCENKRYWFLRMVMGHRNSSAQFAHLMDLLLSDIDIRELCYFLDDILLASLTIEEHIKKLELILAKFRSANLKLTPSKTELLKREVKFVGLTISADGLKITSDRVQAIMDLQPPRNVKQVQRVMGFFGYNRKFVKDYARIAKPLYALLNKNSKFVWSSSCQESFDLLKQRIADSVTLCIPDVDDPEESFHVTIDASKDGYGATLSQMRDGKRRVCAYFSKSVPPYKKAWGATKLEFMAMYHAIEHWRIYLSGTKFKVITDCASLLHLNKIFRDADPSLVRKIHKLACYNFSIEHVAGSNNEVSDFLSRYVHKGRTVSKSTQTAELAVSSVSISRQSETDTPDQGEETDIEFEPDIPSDFFSELENELSAVENQTSSISDAISDMQNLYQIAQNQCICLDTTGKSQKPTKDQKVMSVNQNNNPPPEALDIEMIKKKQNEDVILQQVKKWLTEGTRPEKIQELRVPAELLKYWKMFALLTLKNGLIVRQWITVDKTDPKNVTTTVDRELLVIPESIKEQTMQLIHSTLLAMHPGVEESVRRCMLHYYWPDMKTDFKLYIAACVTCGENKQPPAYLKAPLKHIIVHSFNDAVSIDHIVPERDVITARRNRYILTITDLFSGYVVAIPTRTQESEESYRCIMHNWILKHGFPKELLADNAPGFSSEFFEQILLSLGIKPTHGTPYKCSSTAKAERSNKRINQALRVTLNDEQIKDWDLYLNYVCFALNSTKSRHTGFTANQIVFGKELNTPLSILCENEEPDLSKIKNKSYAALIRDHHKMIKDITAKARKHAARDFGYADNTYNRNVKGPYFDAGDYCFVLIDCPQHKFSKRWRGPYKIKKAINTHLYLVEMEIEDKICNISKLKHYRTNKFSQLPKSKCSAVSTQTDGTSTTVSAPTTDLVVNTASPPNINVNIPANTLILPNTDSDMPNVRKTTRNTRVPDRLQAGFS